MNPQDLNTIFGEIESAEGLIEINILTVREVIPNAFGGFNFFKNLVHDECTEQDWIQYLMSHPYILQISIGGEFAGIFMVDDLGEVCKVLTCEIHAFILPHMRKYTTSFLKAFAEFIFTNTNFDIIMTTVPDHTKYVIRTLKSIGFKVLGSEKTQFTRNGEDINMNYLCLTIDNFGGV